ncbi:MAG: LysR family transcriptional regulator [Casimicrobiaceae bacterium]
MPSAKSIVQPGDLAFFSTLAASGSLSAAARELGITTPAVSKHLAAMEARAGIALVNRTTRRMSLTPEGVHYVARARRILGEIEDLGQELRRSPDEPRGLLRVNATLGFGRRQIAPLVSRFARKYPGVEVQLQLSVNPPPLTDDAFDVCIRFGAPPDTRVIARRIARNRRLLCAAPSYLDEHGEPRASRDLARHNCITIRQGDGAYGTWRLSKARPERWEVVKVRGNLTTNDGAIAVTWALAGHGILMRAEWDVADWLRSGRLVEVLRQYRTPDADIYVVYPERHRTSGRVRLFTEYVASALRR